MTNLEKIQQWVESNPDINSIEIIGEVTDTLFIMHIFFNEGVQYRSGLYDVEIDETDNITFLDHLR